MSAAQIAKTSNMLKYLSKRHNIYQNISESETPPATPRATQHTCGDDAATPGGGGATGVGVRIRSARCRIRPVKGNVVVSMELRMPISVTQSDGVPLQSATELDNTPDRTRTPSTQRRTSLPMKVRATVCHAPSLSGKSRLNLWDRV